MPPILPRLSLAVLCQDVEYDADCQLFSLNEPLHTVRKPSGESWPFTPATLMLYVQLEDAVGTYRFTAHVHTEQGTVIEPVPAPTTITFAGHTDRSLPIEHVFSFPGLKFPSAGVYEIFVICNHAPLQLLGVVEAAARLRVID